MAQGCSAVEASSGAFLTCSRCDDKFYCSDECQKEDECAGHSSCAVQALLEAADAGPFTPDQFQQAAQLLLHAPRATHPITTDELLREYLTTNSGTGITLATLQALRTALAHPPPNPLEPPPGLLPANLVPAILHATPHLPEGQYSGTSTAFMIDILLVDAIAAALDTLLSHVTNATLPGQPPYPASPTVHNNPAAEHHSGWLPVLHAILQHPRLLKWLFKASIITANSDHCTLADLHATLAWQTAGLHGLPVMPDLPGADAMQLLGDLGAMRSVLGLPACDLLDAGDYSVWNASTGLAKMLMMLQQGVVPLPHASVTEVVSAVITASQGAACHDILKRPDAMRALAQPLEALAADPLVWQQGPYAHHCQGLATVLFDWVASLLGVEGLQQLAQHLARPTIAALDALLELGRDEREAATAVVSSCLAMMTHLAYTPHGQSCMAAAGCVPRWLELAPRWKAQPLVLEQLLLLLQVPFHPMASEIYFRKLHSQQRWTWCKLPQAASKRPPLLDKQMGSVVAMDSIALLLESLKDHNCMVLLVRLLINIVEPWRDSGVCVLLSAPVMAALLAFCRSPAASPLPDPDRARNTDVDLYINASTHFRHAPQLLGMNVLIVMYCKADEGSSSGGPGRPLPVPKVMQELLVKWLEVVTTEDGLHKLAPDGSDDFRTNMRLSMLSHWGGLMRAGALPADFLRQHNMIELCFRFLPFADGDDRMFFMAGEVLDDLVHILLSSTSSSSSTSYMEQLTQQVVQGRIADDIISFLERQVAAARKQGELLASVLEDSAAVQVFFSALAVNYAGSAMTNRQHAQKLLRASAVWELLKASIDNMVMSPGNAGLAEVVGLNVAVAFLDTMLSCGGLRQQQAEVVVKQLGRATVERALKAPWVLPGEAEGLHVAAFLAVFEQEEKAAARAAEPAALASGVPGLAAPAASGRSKASQADHKAVSDASKGQASTSTAAAATRTTTAGAGGPAKVAGGGGGVTARECSVCQAQPEVTFLCGRCETVRYCSAACQRADWKQHKRVCKQPQVT